MNDTKLFSDAQALHGEYCERKNEENHVCVGQVTIKRGEVCLDCPLCSEGCHIEGWNEHAFQEIKVIFQAGGIDMDCMNREAILSAVKCYIALNR